MHNAINHALADVLFCRHFWPSVEFVVVGFGLFFVFAEKQAPEYKLRNFRKTVTKPITSAQRWSKISARTSSTQVRRDHSCTKLPPLQYSKHYAFAPGRNLIYPPSPRLSSLFTNTHFLPGHYRGSKRRGSTRRLGQKAAFKRQHVLPQHDHGHGSR